MTNHLSIWYRSRTTTTTHRGAPSSEDAAAKQLHDMEQQGAHLAGLAHVCAGVLVLLFSLGSLISLSADAFNTVLVSWHRGGLDVPAAISVAVSTLLVLAMDTAMLYAASVLRMLATRGAGAEEKRIHAGMLATAAIMEACTYVYMSALYDRPTTLVLWLLVIARGLAAPVFAVYLAMARRLPVTARDVFSQAELAAGRGMLRDVTVLANDAGASLEKKLRMYGAASSMHDRERSRLAQLIEAVSAPDMPPLAALPAPMAPATIAAIPASLSEERSTAAADPDQEPDPTPPPAPPTPPRRRRTPSERSNVVLLASTGTKPRRADAGRRSQEAAERWQLHCQQAAAILAAEPRISTRELARRLGVHAQRATEVRRAMQPERPERPKAEAAS